MRRGTTGVEAEHRKLRLGGEMHGSTLSFSEEICGIFAFTREKYKLSLRYKARAKIAQILKCPAHHCCTCICCFSRAALWS